MAELMPGRSHDELRAAHQAGAVILANEGRHGRADTYHLCADPKFTCEPHEYVAVMPWSLNLQRALQAYIDDHIPAGAGVDVSGRTLNLREALELFVDGEAIEFTYGPDDVCQGWQRVINMRDLCDAHQLRRAVAYTRTEVSR